MGAARSEDLRLRVVAEVEAGHSRRAAARRFRVGVSSAIRWAKLKAETGGVRPRPRRGESRSPLEAQASWLLALIADEPGLTLAETVERIGRELGLATTDSSVSRFFLRHAISFKKNPARGRAGSAGRGCGAGALEGGPARS